MAALENQIDANFYNLIHQLACTDGEDETMERRGDQRQPFLSSQRIAACRGPGVPDESEFVEVPCHDLSRGGFSFFLPSQPDFDSLVVAFGTPPEVIYMAAEVSHYEQVLVYPSGLVRSIDDQAGQVGDEDRNGQTGTPMVLVGCRFSDRLHK